MARQHVSVILNGFRARIEPGMGIDRFAKLIGMPGASSIQRYLKAEYEKDQLPKDVVEKLLDLVGRGTPPITNDEVTALLAPPLVEKPQPERVKLVEAPEIDRRLTIKVFAAAQGGKGHSIIEYEPVETIPTPSELKGVRDGYGILIKGESMVPAYRPGDYVWVNPHKPPDRDTDVVLYHVPPRGEDAEAIIKTLVTFNDRQWSLRQYNPLADFTESRKDWPICHRIVGKRNVR